jgi:hypothetical protein
MAVENRYANSDIRTDGTLLALLEHIKTGSDLRVMIETVSMLAADDNDSVYRVFPNVDSNIVPLFAAYGTAGIAGLTDVDLGLHHVNDEDCLVATKDLSAAVALTTLNLCGTLANVGKKLWEHAGVFASDDKPSSMDIAVKAKAAASAPGDVYVVLIYAQG